MDIINQDVIPSRMIPYNIKSVEMKPLTPKELSLISRAVVTGDYQYSVEAICNTINLSPNELTIGDFFYFFIRQRIMSFKRMPLIAEWECQGTLFVPKPNADFSEEEQAKISSIGSPCSIQQLSELGSEIENKLMVDVVECGTRASSELYLSNLHIIQLPEDTVLDPTLDFPRANLLPEVIMSMDDPKLNKIVHVAKWIKHGSTLIEKIEHLLDQPDLELYMTARHAEDTYAHGVGKTSTVECTRCNTQALYPVSFSPSIFF